MITKATNFFTAIARWMDGSLFFRGLLAIFNFFKKLCMGSFIARAFIAEPEPLEESMHRSIFVVAINKLLNGVPKIIKPPSQWNAGLSRVLSGSWVVRSTCDNLETPIPPPGKSGGLATDVKVFFQWCLFAIPVWGMAAVLFAAPFLPTMMLAAMMLPILFFTYLSRKFVIDSNLIFLLIFIVVSVIVAFMSLAQRSSLEIVMLTSVFMLSVPVIVACCTTKRSVDLFIKIFAVSAGFTGLIGFYQFVAGYEGNVWMDQEAFGHVDRVSSTFGNPNVYGTYLLLAIPIAAAGIVYFKGFFNKFCAIGITGLLLGNLALTYSRGCYLSLALAVVIFVLIMEKRLVVLFVPAVLALPFMLPSTVLDRILSIVDMSDTSTAFRLNIWRGSLRILQDFWISGVGQGIYAYNTVYPFYSLAAIYSPHSHSLYIQYLVELGIGGFLVFIVMLGCFFRTMVSFLRHCTDFKQRVMAAAMVAATLGFLFQGVTDFVFYNYRVFLAFYLFLGICIAFAKVNKPKKAIAKSEVVSGYHD